MKINNLIDYIHSEKSIPDMYPRYMAEDFIIHVTNKIDFLYKNPLCIGYLSPKDFKCESKNEKCDEYFLKKLALLSTINISTSNLTQCCNLCIEHFPRLNFKRESLFFSINGIKFEVEHGEFIVAFKDYEFISPQTILHYVAHHNYNPPDQYVESVNNVDVMSFFYKYVDSMVKQGIDEYILYEIINFSKVKDFIIDVDDYMNTLKFDFSGLFF